MGHYRSEMWHPLDDPKVRADYEQRQKDEIKRAVKNNSTGRLEIKVGYKVQVYKPLFKKSRINVEKNDNSKTANTIWDNIQAFDYGDRSRLYFLKQKEFKVYAVSDTSIRLDEPRDGFLDAYLSCWFDKNYFTITKFNFEDKEKNL